MGKQLASTLAAITLAGALAASLAACDSDAATAPPPTPSPTPTSATPSPSASASPTPPAMPEAAKAHTRTGAAAFARFYVEAVNYGELTLDTSVISDVSSPTCEACQTGIRALREIAKQDGHIVGGRNTVTAIHAAPVRAGHSELVVLTMAVEPERVVIPRKKDEQRPGGTSKLAVGLLPTAGGWLVGDFRKIQ